MARPTKNSTSRRWWVGNLILRACRVVLGVGKPCDWSVIREGPLQKIDQAIDLGRQHGIHITLNFHRIPGYCINGCELELADLFTGTKAQRDKALDAGVYQWKAFARRYKGIPNRHLSFDLINEPPQNVGEVGRFQQDATCGRAGVDGRQPGCGRSGVGIFSVGAARKLRSHGQRTRGRDNTKTSRAINWIAGYSSC
jgi:hypothetical protein